jgi:hypothetical protein
MSSIIKVDTVQDQDGNNIINENANTITIGASGDTITIPSGATLANNGTATGFFEGIAWQSITTAATLTTVAGKGYPINTTSNACTVTLPSSASVGDQIQIVDYAGTFATNSITLTSSLNIEGGTDDKNLTTNREGVIITYVDVTQGWVATTGINSGDQALDPITYSADFLVVAGGGGGGYWSANDWACGGGGAGGYRTSTQTFNGGTLYTITVGDGGGVQVNGSDSSISGSGLTTITSAGGGSGAYKSGNTPNGWTGSNGGSGGGGSSNDSPLIAPGSGGTGDTPATTPSQGNDGGTGINSVNTSGGGGGGAGALGGNSSPSTGGNGGNGTASSITGSSVTRAGGGGGGGGYSASTGTGGTAGTGGGGAGSGTGNATSATVNTGGGGGGARGSFTSGSGGKGVVILSVPDANYSGTTTGSPTVATGVSGKTVLTFTGTGSYTA